MTIDYGCILIYIYKCVCVCVCVYVFKAVGGHTGCVEHYRRLTVDE